MTKLLTFTVFLASFGVLFTTAPTRSQTPDDVERNLPRHDAVCLGSSVSKRKLAGYLLAQASTKNSDVLSAAISGPDTWRTIFTDNNFCKVPSSCTKNPNTAACKAAAKCVLAKEFAEGESIRFFVLLNSEVKKPNRAYSESSALAALANDPNAESENYFREENNEYSISCTRNDIPAAAPPFDPTKDPILKNIRIRGLSDDLWIDRDDLRFKGTTSATGNFSGDSSAAHTYTTKVAGSIGYAFDVDSKTQVVPYFSIYQSLTDTQFKPRTFDANDNIAGGVLVQSYFNYGDVTNIVAIKPQYLLYTNGFNEAELASLRAIYTPMTDVLNRFIRLDFVAGAPWWQWTLN
jgi:hypothetical protein